jgi:mono/diheme cytochrome c family protein
MFVRMMITIAAIALLAAAGSGIAASPASGASGPPSIARGKYLVTIGACNDCHSPGWRESDGTLPVGKWLVGSSTGLREAWGTAYPANLRVLFTRIDEAQWLFAVRTRGGRMQWHDLRVLTTDDQRSIYRFVRSLGPKGGLTPDEVPPDREPTTPYIDLRLHTPGPRR